MNKEELEKEAEEYALNQWEGNLPWSVIQKSYYDGALPREKQIRIDAEQIRALQKQNGELTDKVAELEKENAELKEKYAKNITDCDICDTYCNSQLTKAKEIIKTFCGFCSVFNSTNGSFDNLIAEAEQFLSEVEK